MTMTARALALPVLLLLVFNGCDCNSTPPQSLDVCASIDGNQPDHPGSCTESAACGDHYACRDVKDRDGLKCCLLADRTCNTEADCCPGQTCPAGRKKCFDKYLACDTDADCGDTGDQVCELWTDSYGSSNRCRFEACGEGLGACPDGQSCFQGECMAALPCNGSCEAGTACVPSVGRCQEFACPATCESGFLATFKDNRNIWDTCNRPAAECVCAELPPLRSNDEGRFSAIAVNEATSEILVSGYDGEFGDLVVYSYDKSGSQTRATYVDGVPTSGEVKYGPSGARNGIAAPGPNVGRYTDVVTAGGRAYVSYYDVDNGDLKLATRDAAGTWNSFTVDGASGDVGRYTSIAVDSEGRLGIAYFQLGGSDAFNPAECPGAQPSGSKAYITALKFAKAKSATPASASDFDIQLLACQTRTAPPCDGCTNICANPGSGPSCYAPASGCTGCDPNTEACVQVGTTARCAKKENPSILTDVTDGVGLFTSLAFKGTEAQVAFMRRQDGDGDLMGVQVQGSGVVSPPVLLDGTGDTGYFPDVKVSPADGKLAVAYHDATSRQLKLFSNTALATGVTPEIIDPGAGAAGSGDSTFVGTDTSLVFLPDARLVAIYQDATKGDLKLALRSGGWERLSPIRSEGAVGFFADGVLLDGTIFASHARIQAKSALQGPTLANKLLLEALPVP